LRSARGTADKQFMALMMIVIIGVIAIYYGIQSELGLNANSILVIVGFVLFAVAVIIYKRFID
jgi:hypothetical protein